MTDIKKYLTAEQERVINDFQRVAREIMPEGASSLSLHFYGPDDAFEGVDLQSGGQCFFGSTVRNGEPLSASVNDAIHKCKTKIKSPTEKAKADYDNAVKAMEDAKAKLDALP